MKPYYKQSHRAWYVNLNGKQIRLATEEQAAWVEFDKIVGHQEGKYRVSELVELFLREQRHPGTQRFYERSLRRFVSQVGAMNVRDLKVHHVSGSRSYCRAVKRCLAWSEEKDYIKVSPLHKLKLPPATNRGDDAYLDPNRIKKLLASIIDSDLLDVAIILHETGCRPREARMVEARHFDQANHLWAFAASESKGGIARVVHLSETAYNLCRRMSLKHPFGPLFRCKGKPWTARRLCKKFQKYNISAYQLRHSFVTECLVRGLDLQTVATLVGHTDTKMVSKVYQHLQKRSDYLKQELKRATA